MGVAVGYSIKEVADYFDLPQIRNLPLCLLLMVAQHLDQINRRKHLVGARV